MVFSQNATHFINPADEQVPDQNPSLSSVYHVGDIFNIAWSTPEEVVTLIINQQNSSLTEIDYLPNSVALTRASYSWKVTIDGSDGGSIFDLALDNQFNFQLYKTNGTEPIALSAFFNITNSTVDQYGRLISSNTLPSTLPTITTALQSETTSTTSSMTQVLPISASTTMKPVSAAPSSKSKSMVIIGALLGVIVFLGVAVSLGVCCFMLKKRNTRVENNTDPAPKYSSSEYNELQEYRQEEWKPPPELHLKINSNFQVFELPS
ncbi:hypothetical protein V8E51_018549 [Hyaloscypha variabilis]